MGMSSYILDNEEKFWDSVTQIVSESETVEEAIGESVKIAKIDIPHLDIDDIKSQVDCYFNEFWSNYV